MKFRMRGLLTLPAALAIALVPATNALSSAVVGSTGSYPWAKPGGSPDKRADELIAKMTLNDKIALLHGVTKDGYIGYVPANPRLGIPYLGLTDGPGGVRQHGTTALPAPIGLAATWNRSSATSYGDVLGTETRATGQNILLGPNVNIARVPQNGRTFEALGEDPYLAGRTATPEIKAIQSKHVIATVKHYDANNQETNRTTENDVVGQRTLHEIYLPAFRAAVRDGHVGSVMCSYNKVNGPWACENPPLLGVLRSAGWKFPGFVMSDWGATHSTSKAANAGLDQEMPTGVYFADKLAAAVRGGEVSTARLNSMVHRVLRTMFADGVFDHPPGTSPVPVRRDAGAARDVATDGTVLLRNTHSALPLPAHGSLALIGADANTSATSGGGSAHVQPVDPDTLANAIRARAHGSSVTLARGSDAVSAGDDLPGLQAVPSGSMTPGSGVGHGLSATYYSSTDFSGSPSLHRTDPQVDFDWSWYDASSLRGSSAPAPPPSTGKGSVRWAGTFTAPVTGSYTFDLTGAGTASVYLDGKKKITTSSGGLSTKQATLHLKAGQRHALRVDYSYTSTGRIKFGWRPPARAYDANIRRAVRAARKAHTAVVVARDYETEATDRPSLTLPNNQNRLIDAVTAANPRTVVVLETGAPVTMPWLSHTASVVEAWYPGERGGHALTGVLYGDHDPAGRLPITFPRRADDVPAHTRAQYPGVGGQVHYSEGLNVGYRHYDTAGITPLFPFGYGLSYTTFRLGAPRIRALGHDRYAVTTTVRNTGHRSGSTVVQTYVGSPRSAGEPPRRLGGFTKVALRPGQSRQVRIVLDRDAFTQWSEKHHGWVITPGGYRVSVGTSSRRLAGGTTVHPS